MREYGLAVGSRSALSDRDILLHFDLARGVFNWILGGCYCLSSFHERAGFLSDVFLIGFYSLSYHIFN